MAYRLHQVYQRHHAGSLHARSCCLPCWSSFLVAGVSDQAGEWKCGVNTCAHFQTGLEVADKAAADTSQNALQGVQPCCTTLTALSCKPARL